MSEAANTQGTQDEQQVKEAKLRAFSMGIGRFCKAAGVDYDELARQINVTPDDLAPTLVHLMSDAASE